MPMRKLIQCPRRIVICGALLVLGFMPATATHAQDLDHWVVVEVTGQATQRGADGAAEVIAPGAILRPGAAIKTGADGRLVIEHRHDRMTVSPDSEFEVVRNPSPTGPNIIDKLGTLLFHIEHTPGRRFEVQAPYLAAVVKGTVFTVNAGGSDNAVHLAEGSVEVTSSVSHETILLRPGQTAVVSSAGRILSLLGRGGTHGEPARRSDAGASGPATADASGTAPEIAHTLGETSVNIAALTHGLVTDGAGSRAGVAPVGSRGGAGADGVDAARSVDDAVNGGVNVNGSINAAGSNASTMGGNPNAMGGNPNAMGGNPNAAGGNVMAAGGNPNVVSGALGAAGGIVNGTIGNLNATVNAALGGAKKGGTGKGKP